ncbi:hypothetical protein Plhal304r1_c019g0067291 [Plasmopara halstedii]
MLISDHLAVVTVDTEQSFRCNVLIKKNYRHTQTSTELSALYNLFGRMAAKMHRMYMYSSDDFFLPRNIL